MNIKQGMISETQIDLGVVSRFFAFQVRAALRCAAPAVLPMRYRAVV